LYLEVLPNLDELFTDVDIPFNCEFLVAYPEGDLVNLTEVYRMSSDHPLQKYRFGNWTPHGGLISPLDSLSQRRNNLQGIALKTGYIEVWFIERYYEFLYIEIRHISLFFKMYSKILCLNRDIDNYHYLTVTLRMYVADFLICSINVGRKYPVFKPRQNYVMIAISFISIE